MSKLIVAYTVAGLSLFGALFAALALSGLARPGPTVEQIAEVEAASEPPAPLPTVYTPPPLESNRVYRISHETPVYAAPAHGEPDRQMLPSRGFFRVVQTLETPPGPWFEIILSDGVKESTMYLYGMDLRWKTLTPQYSADEMAKMKTDLAIQRLRDMGLFVKRKPEVEVALEPEPQTFDEWWAEAGQRLGGPISANLIVSAGAAGTATILILGSIAILAVLRREHTWSRPTMHGDLDAGMDEDDPYVYAAGDHSDHGGVDSHEDQFRA